MGFAAEMDDFVKGWDAVDKWRTSKSHRAYYDALTEKNKPAPDWPDAPGMPEGGEMAPIPAAGGTEVTDPQKTSSTRTMENVGGRPIDQHMYNYYRTQWKLGHIPAASIVGNLMRESGGDPRVFSGDRAGDSGNSFYAAQWNQGRLDNLKAFAADRGNPKPTLQDQLDFVMEEMNPGSKYVDKVAAAMFPKLQAATDLNTGVKLFQMGFERPGDPEGDFGPRLKYAQALGDTGGAAGDFSFDTAGGGGGATGGGKVKQEDEQVAEAPAIVEEEAEPLSASLSFDLPEVAIPEISPAFIPVPDSTQQMALLEQAQQQEIQPGGQSPWLEQQSRPAVWAAKGGVLPEPVQKFQGGGAPVGVGTAVQPVNNPNNPSGNPDQYSPTRYYTQRLPASTPSTFTPRRVGATPLPGPTQVPAVSDSVARFRQVKADAAARVKAKADAEAAALAAQRAHEMEMARLAAMKNKGPAQRKEPYRGGLGSSGGGGGMGGNYSTSGGYQGGVGGGYGARGVGGGVSGKGGGWGGIGGYGGGLGAGGKSSARGGGLYQQGGIIPEPEEDTMAYARGGNVPQVPSIDPAYWQKTQRKFKGTSSRAEEGGQGARDRAAREVRQGFSTAVRIGEGGEEAPRREAPSREAPSREAPKVGKKGVAAKAKSKAKAKTKKADTGPETTEAPKPGTPTPAQPKPGRLSDEFVKPETATPAQPKPGRLSEEYTPDLIPTPPQPLPGRLSDENAAAPPVIPEPEAPVIPPPADPAGTSAETGWRKRRLPGPEQGPPAPPPAPDPFTTEPIPEPFSTVVPPRPRIDMPDTTLPAVTQLQVAPAVPPEQATPAVDPRPIIEHAEKLIAAGVDLRIIADTLRRQGLPENLWPRGVVGFARGGAVPEEDDAPISPRAESAGYTTSAPGATGPSSARPRAAPAPSVAPDQPAEPAAAPERERMRPTPELMTQVKQATAGGARFIARHFGMDEQQTGAIPTQDGGARAQAGMQRFVQGEGAATPDEIQRVDQTIGMDPQMAEGDKNMERMARVMNWYLMRGRKDDAEAAAASFMMYGANRFGQLGSLAAVAYQKGDLDRTIKYLEKAYEMIPDGGALDVTRSGNKLIATHIDGDGNETEHELTAQEIPGLIQQVQSKSGYWQMVSRLGDPEGTKSRDLEARDIREENRAARRDRAKLLEGRDYTEGYESYKNERERRELLETEGRAEARKKLEAKEKSAEEQAKEVRQNQEADRRRLRDEALYRDRWLKDPDKQRADWDTVVAPLWETARRAMDDYRKDPANADLKKTLDESASRLADVLPEKTRLEDMQDMGFWADDYTYTSKVAEAMAGSQPMPRTTEVAPAKYPDAKPGLTKDGKPIWVIEQGGKKLAVPVE